MGFAHLGQCAYKSEEDFIKGGYYEQMQYEAFDELKVTLKAIKSEPNEFKDYWLNEAESFDHPAQEQEKQMCLNRANDIERLLNQISK